MSRVMVVGAGVGGLAAAARLAALGHDVTVLEQADVVGGKLGTEAHDGYVFDTGPSLLTLPHVLEELFEATGAPMDEVLPLQRLEVACRYRFPDGVEVDLPGDASLVPAALEAALGPGRGDQWASLMERARRTWELTRGPFLESPVGWADLLRVAADPRDLVMLAPWRSLRGVGAGYLADPRLRMLLDRYATYTGSDPRRAPAALLTVPYAEQAFGSWYVPGGLGRIAAALLDRLDALGARVRTGARVEEVLLEGGRASGVRLEGGEVVPADLVVANADASRLYDDLLPGRAGRRGRRRLARTTPSLSGFALLLALDDPPPEQPHHRVLFAEDYDAEFDAVFGRRGRARPATRPTVYVAVPDDPAVVPHAGAAAWFVLVNAPRHDPAGGTDWDRPGLREDHADHVLDVMADRGLDVRDRITRRTVLTPADLERRTLTAGGSIYGTSSNGARAAFLRPRNDSGVPGLYLVGGSSHPGGGLPLVVMSARIVADLVGPAVATQS